MSNTCILVILTFLLTPLSKLADNPPPGMQQTYWMTLLIGEGQTPELRCNSGLFLPEI